MPARAEQPLSSERPIVVEIRPDPFERRQVARWILGAFEVIVAATIVSTITGWLGIILALSVSGLIGNDAFGGIVTALIWGPVFGLAGAYLTLRFLAR